MKTLGYYFFKYWVALGLFFYYRKIVVIGLENIPKNKPLLFLSNHQNALLDVLLIATKCRRKPWFLARADVFKSRFFSPFFKFLQMLPIYRMRDGKASLANNESIFNQCGELLNSDEGLLIFPEANHNLRRRVRPLSKGFTRIIAKALAKDPECDIHLIPIGQNYQRPTEFGDNAALHFGKAIRVQDFLTNNYNEDIKNLKTAVSKGLRHLTIHIDCEKEYESIINQLNSHHVSYTNPTIVNDYLTNPQAKINDLPKHKTFVWSKFTIWVFYLLNFPAVLIWKTLLKPKVPEEEFMGTFRFGFAMVVYPIFYLLCFICFNNAFNMKTACLFVVGHAVLNLFLIKTKV